MFLFRQKVAICKFNLQKIDKTYRTDIWYQVRHLHVLSGINPGRPHPFPLLGYAPETRKSCVRNSSETIKDIDFKLFVRYSGTQDATLLHLARNDLTTSCDSNIPMNENTVKYRFLFNTPML